MSCDCSCDVCADCEEGDREPPLTPAQQEEHRRAYAAKQAWAMSEPDTIEKSMYRAQQAMIERLERAMFGYGA